MAREAQPAEWVIGCLRPLVHLVNGGLDSLDGKVCGYVLVYGYTTHCSLLTTHYSLLTTHYSLLTTHYSLLTTHYSLLTN